MPQSSSSGGGEDSQSSAQQSGAQQSSAHLKAASTPGWASRLSDAWDVGVAVLRLDEHLDFVSERARSLVGASAADFEDGWRHVHAQVAPALETARSKGISPVEVEIRAPRSGLPDIRVQVHLLDEPECAGYLLVMQTTARAQAIERSLRHAAQSRALRSLARDTAHDLKDVLNVISVNMELLSRMVVDGLSDPARTRSANRSAEVVSRELKRIDRSLDTLLDRNMVERDGPRTFDLKEMCGSLLDLIAARATRQHVEIRSKMSEGTAEIRGFPDRMHGALLGLLVNALDAMPQGGILRLSIAKTTTIQICLCDTGPGIAPERLPKIWRLHFTTKSLGTGLGLYVARATVEAQGGMISYQPNPTGGSCFVIDLPTR